MRTRRRLASLVVTALAAAGLQVVLASTAAAGSLPETTWPAAKTPYQPTGTNRYFRPDGDLSIVTEQTTTGLSVANLANGARRILVNDPNQRYTVDGAISDDASVIVVRSGVSDNYPRVAKTFSVLTDFDPQTLLGGTFTTYTLAPGHDIPNLALSGDGSRAALGGEGISIVDTATGALTQVVAPVACMTNGHANDNYQVALDRTGTTLATYVGAPCNNGVHEARVYDITNLAAPTLLWSAVQEAQPRPFVCAGAVDRPAPIAISDDGSTVAVRDLHAPDASGRVTGQVRVHDLAANTDVIQLAGSGRICSIALSEDGSRLAAQTGDTRSNNFFSFDGGDWGESVWVTDTASGSTPVLIAQRDWKPAPYDQYDGWGWALHGLSDDGTAVLFSGRGYAGGYYTEMYVARDPASFALEWPSGAALTSTQVGQSFVSLDWPEATGAVSSYHLTGGPTPVDVPAAETSATVSGLSPATAYHFTVTARNSSAESDPLTLDVTSASPAGPGAAALSALVTADDTVALQWDPASGVDGYQVLRKSGAGAFATVSEVGSGVTQWTDPTTTGSTPYTYRVASVTAGVAAAHTMDTTVTTSPVAVASVSALVSQSLGYAVPGSAVPVHVVGQPHRTATASLAVQGVASPAPVALTETSPGKYDGSLAVPVGATGVDSVSAVLKDAVGTGTGHTASKTTALGLSVGGALTLHLTSTGFHGRATASSDSHGWSLSSPLNLSANVTRVIGVPPATDIKLAYLRDADGVVLPGQSGLTVAAGQVLDLPTRQLSEPATLRLDAGADVPGALIEVEQGSFTRQARLDQNGKATMTGLSAGPVTLYLSPTDPESWRFDPLTPVSPSLQVGNNDIDLPLGPRAVATLSGTLSPPGSSVPLGGAAVSVVQERGSGSVTRYAYTDGDGHFTVTGLLAGLNTTVGVKHRVLATQALESVSLDPGDNDIDIPLHTLDGYLVNASINFQDASGGITSSPLEWRTATHYQAVLTGPAERLGPGAFGSGGPVLVVGLPGKAVTLCADGREAGYDSGCATATLPASSSTPVDLALTLSAMGRTAVSVSLRTGAGAKDTNRLVQLVATRDAESVTADLTVDDNTFSVPSGTWDVTVVDPSTSQVLADLPGRSLTGASTSLGTLNLAAEAPYAGAGNGVTSLQPSATPGGLIDLTASWSPSSAQPAGALTFKLPSSVTVDDPAVAATLNGAPVAATMSGRTLTIPVPALSALGSGHATLHLRENSDDERGHHRAATSPGDHIVVRAAIDGHPIGAAVVDLPAVTVVTPSRVPGHTLRLSGRAPRGEVVTIYSDGVVVGSALTTLSGGWKGSVVLPAGARHTIVAVSGNASSAPVSVQIDQFAPDFRAVTISQEGVRSYTTEPGATYPFVVVPSQPMTVSTTLADGTRLASLDAVLDGVHHPMTRAGNTWTVSFVPGLARSEISFEYVEAELPTDLPLESLGEPIPDSVDDYLNSLPLSEAQAVGSPDAVMSGGNHATVTTDEASLDITWSDATGTSTAGLRQVAQGAWVHTPAALSVSGNTVTGSLTLLVLDSGARAGRQAPNPATLKKVELAFTVASTLEDEREANEADSKYETLSDLVNRASTCSPASFNAFKDQLDNLLREALAIDAAGAAIEVGGLLLAPETFGIGTVALWGVGFILSQLMDAKIEGEMDAIKAQMDADPSCAKPKPKPGNGGGGGGGGGGPGDPGDNPGAHPSWIYDPSGTITDGVDPIAGATATLSHAYAEPGPYAVWDAAAFEQDNNQVTGTEGAYGWNVPEGWYIVTATAPGRVPASSTALQVLPPRTGVDLVLAPEELPSVVSATATGTVVTVTFAAWMRTAFLTGSQLTLVDADDAPVTATVTPVGVRVGTDGATYAKSVTLTVAAPASSPETLDLTVAAGVQDVIGRPMAADYTSTVTVSGPVGPNPECTRLQQVSVAAAAKVAAATKALATATASLTKATKKLKKLKKKHAPKKKIKAAKKKVKAATATRDGAQTALTTARTAASAAAAAAAACH